MKIGVDTNILVYAHFPQFSEHDAVRTWIYRHLKSAEHILVTTPMILHEFVHVVTDSRRFAPPVPIREALGVARTWLGKANVECVSTTEAACALAFELIDTHGLGRKRLADALLTATLLIHGIEILATRNASDFEIFRDLKLVDPLVG